MSFVASNPKFNATVADGAILIGIATRMGLANPRLVVNEEGSMPNLRETALEDLDEKPTGAVYLALRVDGAQNSVNVAETFDEFRRDLWDGLQRFVGNLGQAGAAPQRILNLLQGLAGVKEQVREELGL